MKDLETSDFKKNLNRKHFETSDIKPNPNRKNLETSDIKRDSNRKNISTDEKRKKIKNRNRDRKNKSEIKSGQRTLDPLFNSMKGFENLKTHINNIEKNIDNNIEKNIDIKKSDNKDKNEKNFWNFLCYRISFRKKNQHFKVYENFRMKLISEEHFMRNHLNIYNLMKITEMKSKRRNTHFHLNNVIKLI